MSTGDTFGVGLRRGYALLLLIFGGALIIGGVRLAGVGGSLYYLIAGLTTVASGVLLWRGSTRGAALYVAVLVGTLAWGIWEVGFDAWGLVARLALPFVLGLPLLARSVRGSSGGSSSGTLNLGRGRPFRGWTLLAGVFAAALCVGAGLHALAAKRVDPLLQRGTLASAPAPLSQPLAQLSRGDWLHYGNDQGGTRFSPLTQITPANVGGLEVAWEADVGPAAPGPQNALQVTPINVGDALYLCNGHNVLFALDAETGRERWRFDMTRDTMPSGKPCRGVSYYRVPDASGVCAERILAISQTPELYALDAHTGRPCADFGAGGRVSLRNGLGEIPPGYYYIASAPQIVRGKVVVGGAVLDGQYWGEPSGVIRAFDVVTGRLAWAFDVGNPSNRGEPASGETYTLATPNSWAPISADETLGLVYLPTGNATPDFYGGQRRPFDDDISSSVIALDVETGELRWRFQTVHHDIWDYDVPSQPTLVDLPTSEGVRRALIQPTKRGEIFVLDRETGKPIKGVSELPVPQGGIAPGERLSPTQPFSVEMPSFRAPVLRESDMWGITPLDQLECRILFKQSRYEGTLTPVNLERPTIIEPGFSGTSNWGGVSVDIDRGILVVSWLRMPSRVTLLTREDARARNMRLFDGTTAQGSPLHPMEKTEYAAIPGAFLSPTGIPCSPPPWGLLTTVDLASGRVIWSQPLGDGRDSGPWKMRSHLPITMGVPLNGGSMTTRGGLIFIGATVDSMFRAFDTRTGKRLWQASLPGAGIATPMTYQSSASGRQFVVIAAGGRVSMNTRLSTKVVAYALPR